MEIQGPENHQFKTEIVTIQPTSWQDVSVLTSCFANYKKLFIYTYIRIYIYNRKSEINNYIYMRKYIHVKQI